MQTPFEYDEGHLVTFLCRKALETMMQTCCQREWTVCVVIMLVE
jgi:hypothetical protein